MAYVCDIALIEADRAGLVFALAHMAQGFLACLLYHRVAGRTRMGCRSRPIVRAAAVVGWG
jgi:hypothetical protein